MLQRTTAINKILALKKRIKIIQGGTSAGKTFGILPVLIDKATKKSGNGRKIWGVVMTKQRGAAGLIIVLNNSRITIRRIV